jgi:hypothetical protein
MSEYRPSWWPRVQNRSFASEVAMNVTDLCLSLHMAHVGSKEMTAEKRDLYVRSLKWLLLNWKEPTSIFDGGIRSLVLYTLLELEPNKCPLDCLTTNTTNGNNCYE